MKRLVEEGVLQPKLEVGSPDSAVEREADRVAETVPRTPHGSTAEGPNPVEISNEVLGSSGGDTRPIQPKGQNGVSTTDERLERSVQGLQGGGRQLPDGVRSDFEGLFGHDFEDVRIYSGAKATRATQAVSTNAFTVNRDIYVRSGMYSPSTEQGKRLLAHELTHVVQQARSTDQAAGACSDIRTVEERAEREATMVARQVTAGKRVNVRARAISTVQGNGGLYHNPADPTSLTPQQHYRLHGSPPSGYRVDESGNVVKRGEIYPRGYVPKYSCEGGLVTTNGGMTVHDLDGVTGTRMTIQDFNLRYCPERVLRHATDTYAEERQVPQYELYFRTRYEVLTSDAADQLNTRGGTITNIVSGITGTLAGGLVGMWNPFAGGAAGFTIGLATAEAMGRQLHSFRAGDVIDYEHHQVYDHDRDVTETTECVKLTGPRTMMVEGGPASVHRTFTDTCNTRDVR